MADRDDLVDIEALLASRRGHIARRTFCAVGASLVAGELITLAAGCGGSVGAPDLGSPDLAGPTGSGSCGSSMILAAATSSVPVGSAKRIRASGLDAWMCHDASGFYALDNFCTHQGCPVSFRSNDTFFCGCHGATYDFNGEPTNGIAPSTMDHLAMCIDSSGNAYIDPNMTVSPTTRV